MFVTLFALHALLTLRPPAASPPAARHDARAQASLRSDELYSKSARRRIATYLRLRLLELQEERLGRAADVVRGRLPIEELLRSEEMKPEK